MDSRISLNLVLGGVIIVALSISSHEQTQYIIFSVLFISEGSVFPDHLVF